MNCRLKTKFQFKRIFLIAFVFFLAIRPLSAAQVRVAVASNFYSALQDLAADFERETSHSVVVIPGSTGKHFAQIVNGAPFDVFLAADVERPSKLAALPQFSNSRIKNYAVGRLVLWKPGAFSASQAKMALFEDYKFLAIANPRLAPYGAAAQRVLESLNLVEQAEKRWIRGENIAQAFQFVASGNAELGFVAESQLLAARAVQKPDFWQVPQPLYPPIEQAAVLLTESAHSNAFFDFLSSERGLQIIEANGYDRP